ncbi:MAG: permease-like cell division protein FtsX [Clostridiales bacterium]|nr:permease-like cell division protein FtsX [Clostridiales bacterium]
MKGASLKYLTKEGFRSIKINGLMSLASVTVLMACLILIGLGTMVYFNIETLLDTIESQNVIMVYIEEGTSEEERDILANHIKVLDNIEECILVPKEDAFKEQLESMGDDAVLFEGLENPLPDAYKIVVKDMEKFDKTVNQLKKMDKIETVRENSDVADRLVNIRRAVTSIGIGIVALLFIVALFIISNTVRITMFARKLEISIMKAVGATSWFIRWPFMIEGIVLGIISAVVSFGVLAGLYQLLKYVCGNLLALFKPIAFFDYAGLVIGIFLIVGVVTGSLGSLFSMGKYLKEQGAVISED